MGKPVAQSITDAREVVVKTKKGTNVAFSAKNRNAGIFAGSCTRKGKIASSSFEVYVPIVETATKGRVIADGSLGYLGKISNPIELIFEAGYLVEINGGEDAFRLKKYMESFGDKEMSIFRQPFQTLQEHLYAIILCTVCFIHLQRSILMLREDLHMCLLYLSR